MANPYGCNSDSNFYDGSDGCGGGGTTPPNLSDYAKKTEVKDYDEVELLSKDTKKKGTIYIGDDNKLYIYDGSNYIKTGDDDTTNIPIQRNNCDEGIAPADSELKGIEKKKGLFATIYLNCSISEHWQYNGSSWVYLFKVIGSSGFKTLQVNNTDYTISPLSKENVFALRASTSSLTITLPAVADVKDKIFIFKADEAQAPNTIEVEPDGSDRIDNANASIFLKRDGDYLALVSDGDEWHIISKYISSSLPDGEINYLIGDFVYKYRGNMSDNELEDIGYFPLKEGTYTGYKSKYPLASQRMPQSWISGNDWVIPNLDGVFLRNLGGNARAEAELQADDIKSHTHTYTRPSFGKRFGGGNTYGDYATYYPKTQTSTATGGAETRPINIALQLCIIVDTIGKALVLPDTVDVAHSVTVTANGGATKINGKDSEVIYAGVGAYRLEIELPAGKMIDPLGAGEWTLIDAHKGSIEFQLDRSYAQDTKDLNIPFIDLPQEGLLSTTYVYTEEKSFSGATEIELFQTPNYTKLNGTKIEISIRLPYRNNDTNWGGAYSVLYYSVDNGNTWVKFLDSGYDAVMYNNTQAIESWNYTGILDTPEIKASEQIKFKINGKTYNNKTVYLNKFHDIGVVDTALNYGYAQINIVELGTLYGKNPNYNNAPLSTLTFTTITAENGKSELILLEGNIYHIKMDLPPDQRIYSVNSTNPNIKTSIVDSENGFIAVDMPIGGGDSNIAVNVEYKPVRTNDYSLDPNPEGLSDFEFCVLYNYNIGSSPLVDSSDDNFYFTNPKFITTEGLGQPYGRNFGMGIGGAGYDLRKENHWLNDNGWNLNKRPFVISFWVKAYESVNSMYFIGNNVSGTKNKSLHIGWRNATKFTVAFYANDVDFDTPTGVVRADTVDKWFNFVVLHNTVDKKSKLFVNGQLAGELSHPNGQYQSYSNMILGTQGVARTKARLSNIRFMIGNYNQSGYLLTDEQAQNIYTQEKKVLEESR